MKNKKPSKAESIQYWKTGNSEEYRIQIQFDNSMGVIVVGTMDFIHELEKKHSIKAKQEKN